MLLWKDWTPTERRSALAGEDGSASLEFITAGLILLVPLVYLVLAMSALQGGALAVEGAARQAARVYVQAPTPAEAEARAERAVLVGLTDYGLDTAAAEVSVGCVGGTVCLSRNSVVTVTVRVQVPLPLVPAVLTRSPGGSVPLEASATQTVSRFWHAE
jgi:Flp pilus assembly protein TadG